MAKITIQHYLNTNLKPYIINGEKYFKIYLLIRSNNKNTKLKSLVTDDEFTEKEFEEICNDNSSDIYKYISIEKQVYTSIIEKIYEDKKVFDILTLNTYLQNYGKLLISELVDFLKWLKELEILKIEGRYNNAIYSKYEVNDNYKDFNFLKETIEVLKEFVSKLDCKINEDIFVFSWINPEIKASFKKFWIEKGLDLEDTGMEDAITRLFGGMSFNYENVVDVISTILNAKLEKSTIENLLYKDLKNK